jgi:DNA-binding protein H-NS
MRTELAALTKSLEALLEHRAALRKDYVDRDKELGREIKEILARIRELEEMKTDDAADNDETASTEAQSKAQPAPVNERKTRAKYDYQSEVLPLVIELLQENGKMRGADIMRVLRERHHLFFSNPTIAMNKIMALSPRIQKVDKYYTLTELQG